MATKTEQPNEILLDNSNEVRKLVDAIAVGVAAQKRLEKEVEANKDQLKNLARTAYYEFNFQEAEPVHTFDVHGRSYIAQINFENAYFLNKERYDQLIKLLGEDHQAVEHLEHHPVVNVDVRELDEDTRVEFYKQVKELCDEYGVQGFVDDKYIVNEAFHNERHELLPRVNAAVEQILPTKVAVTT